MNGRKNTLLELSWWKKYSVWIHYVLLFCFFFLNDNILDEIWSFKRQNSAFGWTFSIRVVLFHLNNILYNIMINDY